MSIKHQCEGEVTKSTGNWPHSHQCPFNGKVERDGHYYCLKHDPVTRAANARYARFEEKWAKEKSDRAAPARVKELEAELANCATGPWVYPVDGVLPLPKNNCKVIFDVDQEWNPEERGSFSARTKKFYNGDEYEYHPECIKRYAIMNNAKGRVD